MSVTPEIVIERGIKHWTPCKNKMSLYYIRVIITGFFFLIFKNRFQIFIFNRPIYIYIYITTYCIVFIIRNRRHLTIGSYRCLPLKIWNRDSVPVPIFYITVRWFLGLSTWLPIAPYCRIWSHSVGSTPVRWKKKKKTTLIYCTKHKSMPNSKYCQIKRV